MFDTPSDEYQYPKLKLSFTQKTTGGILLAVNFNEQPDHNLIFDTLFRDDFGKSNYYGKGISINEEIGINVRERIEQSINKILIANPTKDLIFSSEQIFHFETHEIEKMINFFKTYTKTIVIVAYVREPTEWACSYFSEN